MITTVNKAPASEGERDNQGSNCEGPPSARSSAAPSPIPSQQYDSLEGGLPFFPNSQGPPSARSSAAPSPIPSQQYDSLEGGLPFFPNSQGPPSARSSAAPSPIPSQQYDSLEGGLPFFPNSQDVPEFEDSSPESDAQSKQKKRKKTERSEYVPESEYSSPESDAEPKQMKRKKTKSSRGNRRPWSKEEACAVWKYFHQDIKKGNTPGKILCMHCIQQNEVLKERSWRDVKYKVRNDMVSMRNSRK